MKSPRPALILLPVLLGWWVAVPTTHSLAEAEKAVSLSQGKRVKLNGYAEFRHGDILIVEGQRVVVAPGAQFKAKGIASPAAIPLGYEVKVEGFRRPDGIVAARKLEAKPNGVALFEPEVLQATNTIEQEWVRQGRMFEPTEAGKEMDIGRIVDRRWSGCDASWTGCVRLTSSRRTFGSGWWTPRNGTRPPWATGRSGCIPDWWTPWETTNWP